MSSESPGPVCPKCRRRLAAWKLDHCVYCGQPFPPGLRDGFTEPEALKWVNRPSISPEAAKQLELMKIVPGEREAQPRALVGILALASLPVFAGIIYLLYSLLRRYSSAVAVLVLLAGVVFLGYLVWMVARTKR